MVTKEERLQEKYVNCSQSELTFLKAKKEAKCQQAEKDFRDAKRKWENLVTECVVLSRLLSQGK